MLMVKGTVSFSYGPCIYIIIPLGVHTKLVTELLISLQIAHPQLGGLRCSW